MKRIFRVLLSIAVLVSLYVGTSLTSATSANLIANPSFETSGDNLPTSWQSGKWGTNTETFTYSTDAHSGLKSATINVTQYSSGDAKWYATPSTVTANTSYTFSDYYKSNVVTRVVIAITSTSGIVTYQELASAPLSSGWAQYSADFITPAGVKDVTVYHLIDRIGSLTIDDVSLTTQVITPTPDPTPTNLIANPSTETPSTVSTIPANWNKGGWGSNTASFSYMASGYDGGKSIYVNISNYVSGDAKWYADQVAVTAGDSYTYSDYYQSSVSTDIYAAYNDTNGNTSYNFLGSTTASSSWRQSSKQFIVPANIVSMTIFHVIATNGWLQTDNFNLSRTVDVTPQPDVNPITNPSFETSSSNSPTDWLRDNWGTNTPAFNYITNDGHGDNSSAKVTISAYNTGDAKWYFKPITSLTPGSEYSFTAWYKTNTQPRAVMMYVDANNVENYLTMTLPIPDTTSATTWQQYSSTFPMPDGAKSLTIFMLISSNGWLQVDDYSITPHTVTGFNQPIISLTFDDGPMATYTNGLPLLRNYGLVSTQYIVTGRLNTPDNMTDAMVKEFQSQGSEIASHTVSHADLTTLTPTVLTQELAQSQVALRNLLGTSVAKNFASPYGNYNQTTLNAIKTYYDSHRSTDNGYNTKDNFDRYNILTKNVISTTTPAEVADWVSSAKANKAWLVLVYHAVEVSGDAYSVTPSNLNAELSNIKSSGISVKTVDQALTDISTQL